MASKTTYTCGRVLSSFSFTDFIPSAFVYFSRYSKDLRTIAEIAETATALPAKAKTMVGDKVSKQVIKRSYEGIEVHSCMSALVMAAGKAIAKEQRC
jgi:hypothetical protein